VVEGPDREAEPRLGRDDVVLGAAVDLPDGEDGPFGGADLAGDDPVEPQGGGGGEVDRVDRGLGARTVTAPAGEGDGEGVRGGHGGTGVESDGARREGHD